MNTQIRDGYYADMYLRISREDGDKAESDSIANQRDLINAFLGDHPEIELHSVRADDGYTGVNFDRPAFRDMMNDVREKKINCIIVKDFSRLGRNFTETGKYIERIFPFMGVRFISINDDYDSIRPRTAADNLVVPFKNLINDAYCRDISTKIRSQLDIKRRKGQCISPFAVYGYRKDPDDRNRLMIDDPAADEVRDMFRMKLDGYSAQAIAGRLNERGVLSPAEYKRMMGSSYATPFKRREKSGWTAAAVLRILNNPVYMGTLVQGKRSSPNYKVKKQFPVPKEQWVIVENAHEPVVSREMFDNVAKVLRADTRTAPGEEAVFPLSGLVYCGDCKRSMVRKNNASSAKPYVYYVCSGSKEKSGCTSHSIRDVLLEQAVLAAVREHIRSVLNIRQTLEAMERLPHTCWKARKAEERLSARRAETETFRRYRMKLHEDYADGILSREDYGAFRSRYDEKIREAEKAISLLEQEIRGLEAGNCEEQQWISYFKENKNISELNRKLAVTLIDRISVYEHQKIHIQFKFRQEYEGILLSPVQPRGGDVTWQEPEETQLPPCGPIPG